MDFESAFDLLDDPSFGLATYFQAKNPIRPSVEELEKLTTKSIISEGFCGKLEIPEDRELIEKSIKFEKKLGDYSKGTTTLAFKYGEGIVIAVDSRASMGQFNASHNVRKVIEINDYLLGTMAGGAADCFFWERYLGSLCNNYELEHRERLTVNSASKLLTSIMLQYRGYGLSMGCMMVGTDLKGPDLYFVDNEGFRLKGSLFSIGSGSIFAYGVLDSGVRPNMKKEEAIELGIKAIVSATFRDAGSGGKVRVYHVDSKGWQKIHDGLDVSPLYDQFYIQNQDPQIV